MKLKMTREIAHAAAWDAGNQSMHAAGRKQWNHEDYNVAAETFDRLWPNLQSGE